MGTGLVHLLGPVAEHGLRSDATLYLGIDVLQSEVSDGVSSSLKESQALVILHDGAIPVQVVR